MVRGTSPPYTRHVTGPLFSRVLFRGIVTALEETVGHEPVWKAVGTLPDSMRGECLDDVSLAFVHAETSVSLVKAVANAQHRDARQLHAIVIRRSAERVFSTLWRVLFKFVTPEAMIARVPLAFAKTYQGIRVDATLEGPLAATIRVRDWPNIDDLSIDGISIGFEVGMELATKSKLTSSYERTPGGVLYHVQWKAIGKTA